VSDTKHPGEVSPDPEFPHAPLEWSHERGLETANSEGLTLVQVHWEAVRALQQYFARHADQPAIHVRELHDALDEKFHAKGGIRYLYQIFPRGPVAQGCRIAGLPAPASAVDKGFGSVE
jgi:tRNA 2-thiouridine synthesizing protein E